MRLLVRNLIWVSATISLSAFIVLMGTLIFPGAMNWTGSVVCPDDQQTTIVVRDTYQTEPGETSTNFTLYCVGERGQFTDAGFLEPVLWLTVWFAALMLVLTSLLRLWAWLRRSRAAPPPGTPTPETVDDGIDIIT